MKKVIFLSVVLFTCVPATSIGQELHNLSADTWKKLNSKDWESRYSAINSLWRESELSKEVVDLLILYLSDLRGKYPANTVAGLSAKLLAKHPKHADRAMPQLLELLTYTGKYGYPAKSASEAIQTVDRKDLERYIKELDREKKIALCESLNLSLDKGIGSIPGLATTAMLMGMLGETKAIPALEKRYENSRKQENNNRNYKKIRVRAETAIKILKSRYKIGDFKYLKAMKEADALLGMPDQYLEPDEIFLHMIKRLHARMQKGGAKTAYILRLDLMPFDHSDFDRFPLARLSSDGGWAFLYLKRHKNLSISTKMQTIILTEVSKIGYSEDFFRSDEMSPSFLPKTPDYAFMELGPNGEIRWDKFLKEFRIEEGYQKNVWYEFWPSEWWVGANRGLSDELPNEQELLWVQIENGRIAAYLSLKKE